MNPAKVLQEKSHPNQQYEQPPTPSLTKRKRAQEKNVINSPTDNFFSPCSQKLLQKNKVGKRIPPVQKFVIDGKENEGTYEAEAEHSGK